MAILEVSMRTKDSFHSFCTKSEASKVESMNMEAYAKRAISVRGILVKGSKENGPFNTLLQLSELCEAQKFGRS